MPDCHLHVLYRHLWLRVYCRLLKIQSNLKDFLYIQVLSDIENYFISLLLVFVLTLVRPVWTLAPSSWFPPTECWRALTWFMVIQGGRQHFRSKLAKLITYKIMHIYSKIVLKCLFARNTLLPVPYIAPLAGSFNHFQTFFAPAQSTQFW